MPKQAEKERICLASGYALGLLANVCYATNPLFSLPLLHAGVGVSSVLFWRYLLALPLYVLLAVGVKKLFPFALPRAAWLPVAVLGLLFGASSLALYSAFLYIDGGLACTILYVYPAMVTLLSVCFFGEKLSWRLLAALAASSVGIALLYRGGNGAVLDLRGVAWALASAAFYALYILGVRHIPSVRTLRAEVLTFYVMLMSMGLFTVRLLLEGTAQLPHAPLHWGCMLGIALIPTIVSLETFTRALHRIGAVRLSILGSAEPLVAIFFGVTFFAESLTLRIICGVLLILSGIMLIVRK
ncbi:MAG: DMT family transporter [Akkermansia sp.]|nr:DMT family transporter [Akkermansia sp.]